MFIGLALGATVAPLIIERYNSEVAAQFDKKVQFVFGILPPIVVTFIVWLIYDFFHIEDMVKVRNFGLGDSKHEAGERSRQDYLKRIKIFGFFYVILQILALVLPLFSRSYAVLSIGVIIATIGAVCGL